MSRFDDFEKIELYIYRKEGEKETFSIENNKDLYTSFGQMLKIERKKRKISQLELSKLCGINSPSYISSIENGRTNPSEKVMMKITEALDFKLFFASGHKDKESI